MAPFADAEDLGLFLQQQVDEDVAALVLAIASGTIRVYVGWSITAEAGVELSTQGTGGDAIWLPTKLLTDVTSVEENGELLTADDDYRWKTSGRVRRVGGRWSCVEQSVDFVFDHGYATTPDDVRGVCLVLASRLHSNPEGLRQWSVDGLSETMAGPSGQDAGLVLTEMEKKALETYVLEGVA
jgi:hypothetical protein